MSNQNEINYGGRYQAQTQGFSVTVMPLYRPERSDPDESIYVWNYHVRIENQSSEEVWLRRRCWIITNARGEQQTVEGTGVVGEEPQLSPGAVFEYASGIPLDTNSGFMEGRYEMENNKGEKFWVTIPLFPLDTPESISTPFH